MDYPGVFLLMFREDGVALLPGVGWVYWKEGKAECYRSLGFTSSKELHHPSTRGCFAVWFDAGAFAP